MEWRQRGIAFGFPERPTRDSWAKKFPLTTYPIDLVRAYHGYAFAWGAIYTFWYHPMEGTQAHAMGFFLTSMIMLQGSLAFTWAHLNPYWKLLVEAWYFPYYIFTFLSLSLSLSLILSRTLKTKTN
jgi:hypothetical protein